MKTGGKVVGNTKELKILLDYPGANARLISQSPGKVVLSQNIGASSWWFYWNFKVSAPPAGETIFEFTSGEVIGPHGPAVSMDGENWRWLGEDSLIEKKTREQWIDQDKLKGSQVFRVRFTGNEKEIYFSRHFPYPVSRLESFLKSTPPGSIRQKTLLTTRKGRSVPLLVLGAEGPSARNVIITCRHHASESHASYVLEGILKRLLGGMPDGVAFHIIPFVDLDGVEDGEQGKCRQPHDHNRDYLPTPLYPETTAIMRYIDPMKLELAFDLHCPGTLGEDRYHAIFYNVHPSMETRYRQFQKKLLDVCDKIPEAAGRYEPRLDVIAESSPQTFSTYARRQGAKLVLTLEQNYFSLGNPLSQAGMTLFGEAFGEAIAASVVARTDD